MKQMKKRENLSLRKGTNRTGVTGALTVTAGEKCKVIGWQDGSFQKFGHHLDNEMGGVWFHPIKTADGFWMEIDGSIPLADEYETLPYGTVYRYESVEGLKITRTQISPDPVRGVLVRYRFENTSGQDRAAALRFLIQFNILPVWFSRESGILDGNDEASFDQASGCIIARDQDHEWYGLVGSSPEMTVSRVTVSKESLCPMEKTEQAVCASAEYPLFLKAGETGEITFYLTGSDHSRGEAVDQYRILREREQELLQEKIARYRSIRSRAALETSDPDFDQAFEWVKYNNDWLIADCAEYGRGLTAGIPEYLWWFGCDNAYSTQGLTSMGEFETARDTLVLLKEYSEKHNGNGRIIHEVTTNGQVSNPGNSQETGHYITAVYNYWRWTGDTQTMAELYDTCARGIEWLLGEMDPDHDMLPSGYGIIEIKGLNVELIDTAVYTCQALYRMYEMSKALGRENPAYLEQGDALRKIINTRLWDEKEQLFVDAVGTPAQIISRIDIMLEDEKHGSEVSPEYHRYLDDMKTRLKAMPQDEEQPFLINKNWVINTPMETALADEDKALSALNTMRSDEFLAPYGVYLAGFMHNNAMTISTGVQAVAEGRYHRTDEALDLLERMFTTFSRNLPGSINEMSPDYGCFTQAWTGYAAAVPVVECFAGFQPAAYENRLTLSPCVPQKWNRMKLSAVRVGNAWIDFDFRREAEKETYIIAASNDCAIDFAPVHSGSRVLVNGAEASLPVRLGQGCSTIEIYRY